MPRLYDCVLQLLCNLTMQTLMYISLAYIIPHRLSWSEHVPVLWSFYRNQTNCRWFTSLMSKALDWMMVQPFFCRFICPRLHLLLFHAMSLGGPRIKGTHQCYLFAADMLFGEQKKILPCFITALIFKLLLLIYQLHDRTYEILSTVYEDSAML